MHGENSKNLTNLHIVRNEIVSVWLVEYTGSTKQRCYAVFGSMSAIMDQHFSYDAHIHIEKCKNCVEYKNQMYK